MLIAITRPTGPALVDCQITYIDRAPIEIDRALAQHAAYVAALLDLGVEVVELDRLPDNPDAVLSRTRRSSLTSSRSCSTRGQRHGWPR